MPEATTRSSRPTRCRPRRTTSAAICAVGSFNVLNYFATIDTTSSNDVGPCGPSGTLDCRGADSAAELAQQRAKIVAALVALDADVVGLSSCRTTAAPPSTDLVAALNARPGADPYAFVDTGVIGGDAIKVAFIYRPSAVTPVGPYEVLDSTVDPRLHRHPQPSGADPDVRGDGDR